VDPATVAQALSRANFGSAAQTWHTLDDAQKANWQSFANEVFQPKVGENLGQFSGFNAFCSLRMTVNHATSLELEPTITDDSETSLDVTFDGFQFSMSPPNQILQANINNGASAPGTLLLSTAAIYADFSFKMTIAFEGIGGSGLLQGQLMDGASQKFGLNFTMSNVVEQVDAFVANPNLQSLGYIPPMTFGDPDLTGVDGMIISGGPGINSNNYQSLPSVGDIVLAKMWAVGESGCTVCLGSLFTTVTENPA
jgi:hypothetical protein